MFFFVRINKKTFIKQVTSKKVKIIVVYCFFYFKLFATLKLKNLSFVSVIFIDGNDVSC